MPIRIEPHAEPIPGYKLIERLGGGGFGEVWKAEAPGGLHKAIKFVYGDLETAGDEGQKAEQELKAMSRVKSVRHPFILSLERYDIVDGQLMIVMELADRNLWDRFKECRTQGLVGIPRDELLRYLEETAEALDLMNSEYQLQHLDIKPQNLFLVYNHIKVADFGLVKDLQGRAGATVTGGITPVYAAPETFDGWISRFCDQYSLAIVYQELLTGVRPFSGNNVHQLVMQHVQGSPNLASLPENDRDIVARALAKNPDGRYPNCLELITNLRAQVDIARPAESEPQPQVVVGQPAKARTERPSSQVRRPSLATSKPAPEPPPPPVEISSEGELYPALVVGLGQAGQEVLQHLREALAKRYGPHSQAQLPHLRLLNVEIDPEAVSALAPASTNGALSRCDVLHARLNRASHYLKPRDNKPPLDSWFDTHLLYRIQRAQVTSGLRALGRLAFVDNFKPILQRLRSELEACLDAKALPTSMASTRLKIRGTRPRVYVVTSLAGGTGGGMFLDLAYVVRRLLKDLGQPQAEVIGLFLLPALEDPAVKPQATLGLGNTYAALKELRHFSSPGTTFSAKYDAREAPLMETVPPFNRFFLLWPPEAAKPMEAEQVAGLAGEFLYRDLMTALGKTADARRDQILAEQPDASSETVFCQSFGMFRFSWPRKKLLRSAARRFSRQLVERWLSKDSKPIKEKVQGWVKEQWDKNELGSETIITSLQMACKDALNQEPEAAFAKTVQAFTAKDKKFTDWDAAALMEALGKIEDMVGQPTQSSVLSKTGCLEEILSDEAGRITADWQEKINKLTLPLMEQPDYRLAGAEEVIRQFVVKIEEVLKQHEHLSKELTEKTAKGFERLEYLLTMVPEIVKGSRRVGSMGPELVELLRLYPKWRYQSLVLKSQNTIYTSLRGHLSDQLRDVGFCRVRLGELLRRLETDHDDSSDIQAGGGQVRYLYPAGCQTLDDVVEYFFAQMPAEDLNQLDGRIQNLINEQFRSLMFICLTSTSMVRNLEEAMLDEAAHFAGSKLAGDDVTAMFLGQHAGEDVIVPVLKEAHDQAAPNVLDLDTFQAQASCVLSLPHGPQESPFRDWIRRTFFDAAWAYATSPDDIVFYREITHIPLNDLEHLGPKGEEAYQQMVAAANFTPHSRCDITDWRDVG